MTGGMPELTSRVAANDFQVMPRSVQSSEAEQLFRTAATAQDFANRFGAKAEQEASQYAAEQGAQAQIYEQMPDGTQRLRPLDDSLAINFGSGRAYNQAYMNNYAGAIQTDARIAYGRFQTTYANNPGGFAAAATAYNQEVVANMPAAARAVVAPQLTQLTTAFAGGIAERGARVAQAQLFATHSLGVENQTRDISSLSRSNAEDPRLPQMVTQLDQSLRALQAEHPGEVTDLTRETAMRNIYRLVESNRVSNGVIAAYSRGSDAATMDYLNQWRARQGRDQAAPAAAGGGTTPQGRWQPPQQTRIPAATAAPGTAPPPSRFTTEEVELIYRHGQATAQDLRAQRELNRQNFEQARSDATFRANREFQLANGRLNPANDPTIAAGQAALVAMATANPDAADAVRIAWQFPNTARAYEVQRAETRERIAALATEKTNVRNSEITAIQEATIAGNIALSRIDPEDTAMRRTVVNEHVMQASTQAGQNQIRANLGNPVEAASWSRAVNARTAASAGQATLTALKIDELNTAAINRGEAVPYPTVHAQKILADQPHLWAGVQRNIEAAQERRRVSGAAALAARGVVAGASMDPNRLRPSQGEGDLTIANAIPDPTSATGFRAIDWTKPEEVRMATSLMNSAGFVGSEARSRIGLGLQIGATFAAAESANTIGGQLTDNPQTRDQMVHLLGADTVSQLEENGLRLGSIRSQATNPDGSFNPETAQRLWGQYQTQRAREASTTTEEGNRLEQNLWGRPHPRATQLTAMVNIANATDRNEDSEGRRAFAYMNPVLGFFISQTLPGSQQLTGLPGLGAWFRGLAGSPFMFLDGNEFGRQVVPVATGENDIPTGMMNNFSAEARRRAIGGETDQTAAAQSAWRYTQLHGWGASFLGSSYDNQSVYVQRGIEATGMRLHNLQPYQSTEQVLSGYARVTTMMRENGVGVREIDPMTALANKDFVMRQVPGTDADPRWTYWIRPPDINGVRQEHQPVVLNPAIATASGVNWNSSGQPEFALRPDQYNVQEQALRERNAAEARSFVAANFPGLSTMETAVLTRYASIQLNLGIGLPSQSVVDTMRQLRGAIPVPRLPVPPATGVGPQVLPPSTGSITPSTTTPRVRPAAPPPPPPQPTD